MFAGTYRLSVLGAVAVLLLGGESAQSATQQAEIGFGGRLMATPRRALQRAFGRTRVEGKPDDARILAGDDGTCEEVLIDFDTDANGAEIPAGTIVDNQWWDWKVEIEGFRRNVNDGFDSGNFAMIFDSANPTGDDRDLGSPNKNCRGIGCTPADPTICPGFARRNDPGFLVANVTNCVGLKKILIIQEEGATEPDDNNYGGYFDFKFGLPISGTVTFGIIDIDVASVDDRIELLDASGNILDTKPIAGLGDNTWQEVTLSSDSPNVAVARIYITTSGAITSFKYCMNGGGAVTAAPTTTATTPYPTIAPTEPAATPYPTITPETPYPTPIPTTCPPDRTISVDFETLPDGGAIAPGGDF